MLVARFHFFYPVEIGEIFKQPLVFWWLPRSVGPTLKWRASYWGRDGVRHDLYRNRQTNEGL